MFSLFEERFFGILKVSEENMLFFYTQSIELVFFIWMSC